MKSDGSREKLEYKPYEEFKTLLNANNTPDTENSSTESVIDYFSVNEDGDVILAEYQVTTQEIISEYTDEEGNKTTSANTSEVKPVYTYTEKAIDYKNIISNYAFDKTKKMIKIEKNLLKSFSFFII